MPAAQPEKVNNPQMAFDFNGRDFNKVVARPLNMEQRDEHEINQDLKASHSAEYSSSLHYEKPVSKSTAPPPPAVVAPDSNELKYITPPEVQPPPPASKPKTAPLPMPAAQPEKVNNPQMAFDFNGRDFNKVVARPLNMEQRDEHEINQDLKLFKELKFLALVLAALASEVLISNECDYHVNVI
ncbi:hypothetical protein COOONC_09251 [Cooperia oncophora]